MKLAANTEVHERTKHIAVRWHFLRWMVESKQLVLLHKPTDELVADDLTKPLSQVSFLEKRAQMNLERKNEKQPKRKALMSRVVPTKRFKPSVFSSMLMFLNLLSFGLLNEQKFDVGSSVIWPKLSKPTIVGFTRFNLKKRLVSLCKLLHLEGLSSNVSLKLKTKCAESYENLFQGELEKICPKIN